MRLQKGFIILAMLVMTAGHAWAQNVVREVSDMNRAAMEDYDLLEFESARQQLNEALIQAKKARLSNHPVVARTHMNLAIVYAGGLGDSGQALVEFMNALEIDPTIELDPAYRSPELERLVTQARANVKQGGAGPTAPGGTSDVRGLVHRLVDEAPAGKDIPIEVQVGSDVDADQVVLFYRVPGAGGFTPVAMREGKGRMYVGRIPGDQTREVSSVHYYIVARSDAGKSLATSASAGSPNIITIESVEDGDAPRGEGGGDGFDDEDPLAGGESGDDAGSGGGKSMFIALSAGSGGAYITDATESAGQPVKCCVALSPVHVMPEIGFWVGPQTTVSLYARIGFPIGANIEGHAKVGPAGLIRMARYMRPGGTGFQFHGDAGFGFIRQTVKLTNVPAPIMGDTDTYATGPLLVGGGFGYLVAMGDSMRFVMDINALVGIPVVEDIGNSAPGFGVNVDANLGIQAVF